VNAKSILMLLSLAMSKGTRVELFADGADETEAIGTLIGLIESGCGEEV
jgi:phosphotransferase system HPr (HPr) family protein